MREKSGREKEKKGENVEGQKQNSKKSNGSQESLQQDVETEGAKPIAQSNVCEWKAAPLISNSYS